MGSVYTIKEVDPRDVHIGHTYESDVAKQMERLRTEGQIEPIRVLHYTHEPYQLDSRHPDFWAYSAELVQAARKLAWDTILVSLRETTP